MNSDNLMSLIVLTPEETVYQEKIQKITIPGTKGAFQVLYNHAPILSTLEPGEVKFLDEKEQEHKFSLETGIVEVLNNNITITAENIKKI